MEQCDGCGDLYRDHRGSYSFIDACARIRHAAARDGDEGGGYRSRGPVLWAMRVLKAEDWLMAHMMCYPDPESIVEWNEADPPF